MAPSFGARFYLAFAGLVAIANTSPLIPRDDARVFEAEEATLKGVVVEKNQAGFTGNPSTPTLTNTPTHPPQAPAT
jgi:hypothetical protein